MVAHIRMSPTSKAVGRDQQGKCQQHRCHCSPRMRTWTPWTHHAQIKESRNSTHILIISNHILVINSYHWKSLKINMTCGFPNPPALQVLCVWHTNNHSFLGREDCSWNWNVFFLMFLYIVALIAFYNSFLRKWSFVWKFIPDLLHFWFFSCSFFFGYAMCSLEKEHIAPTHRTQYWTQISRIVGYLIHRIQVL